MNRYQLPYFFTAIAVGCSLVSSPAQAIVYQDWAQHEPSPYHSGSPVEGLGVDARGNVYITGSYFFPRSMNDYTTLRYTPEGRQLWIARYDGTSHYAQDGATDLAVSPAGDVWVTGHSEGYNFNADYTTVRYSPEGQQSWVARYDNPDHEGDYARAIALDMEGNSYVTGFSFNSANIVSIRTVKYDPQGNEQWVAQYQDSAVVEAEPCGVTVDAEGNVYVAGYSCIDWMERDYVTLKYSSAGVQQWVALYDGASHGWDRATALAVDDQGYVYVTGESQEPNGFNIVTLKYNPAGTVCWEHCYDGPGQGDDEAEDLALDSEGNVLITGSSQEASQNPMLTFKLTREGVLQWVQTYGVYYAVSHDLEVDAEQNVYITGECYDGSIGYYDFTTIKYSPTGVVQWIARYGDPKAMERSYHIALSPEGSVIVAGSFTWYDQIDDSYLTVKYNQVPGNVTVGMIPMVAPIQIPASGGSFSYHLMAVNNVMDSLEVDFWWQVKYPLPSNRIVTIGPTTEALPLDSSAVLRTQNVPANVPSGLYLYILNAGDYPNLIWAADTLMVTKLATGDGLEIADWSNLENGAGINEIGGGSSEGVLTETPALQPELLNVSASPNPFNPATVISFELRAASLVRLEVFDVSGRSVGAKHFPNASPVSGSEASPTMYEAGIHQINFDGSGLPSGIYLYRIKAGEQMATGKIVLMK